MHGHGFHVGDNKACKIERKRSLYVCPYMSVRLLPVFSSIPRHGEGCISLYLASTAYGNTVTGVLWMTVVNFISYRSRAVQ